MLRVGGGSRNEAGYEALLVSEFTFSRGLRP